jgi:Leucine-rich repeat (LRR) protein
VTEVNVTSRKFEGLMVLKRAGPQKCRGCVKQVFTSILPLASALLLGSVVLVRSASSGCSGSISQAEYGALESLYDSAGGKDWAWGSGPTSTQWSFPTDLSIPCSDNWQGLTCATIDSAACAISELELNKFNLRGTLTDSTFNMSSLVILSLSGNELRSSIPSSLLLMSALTTLSLYDNSLTSSIPTEVGALTVLTQLFLYSNNLQGRIPTELGLCTALIELDIDSNQLSNSIPTEIGLLTKVRILYMYLNVFSKSIPSEIGLMTSLTELYLYGNLFHDNLPSQIGLLSVLTQLRVDDNLLTDLIPTEIGQLTALTLAYFFENSLSGFLPSEIGLCTSLNDLQAYDNRLSGSLPTELGQLFELTELDIEINDLHGRLPTEIGSCVALETIYLYTNSLTGEIPSEFGKLRNLDTLELDANLLSSTIPTELGLLSGLLLLFLYDNSLVGTFPSELSNLVSATQILVDSNLLSGSLPTQISTLTNVKVFSVQSNSFSSSLPTELGLLQSVEQLYLSDNTFTQSLPTELGALTNLEILCIYENKIDGSIPAEVNKLRNLEDLELNTNLLSGTVPPDLGALSALTQLNLAENLLTGSLESFFTVNSGPLVNISLYENLITGTISTEIGLLSSSLQLINFGVNSLSGSLPSELSLLTLMYTLLLDINLFSGAIPSLCSLQSMYEFTVSYNAITGTIQSEIGCWTTASDFDVSDNYLSGSLPSEVGLMTSLTELEVGYNMLSATIPTEIGKALLIVEVDLQDNSFSGPIPTEIGFLREAVQMNMQDCFLTGPIPTEIGELKLLFYFNVDDNALSYSIPSEFNSLTLLNSFSAINNMLTGSLPSGIMAYMNTLSLCDNKLTGNLPTEFNSRDLAFVLLCGNSLSGLIASEIGTAKGLYYLSLNENLFDATLPVALSNCSKLTYLDVSSNRLRDTIPSWLFTFSSAIESVIISENGFYGPLPTEYASSLIEILLFDNRISGSIPSEIATASALSELQLQNNKLTSTIPSELGGLGMLISFGLDNNMLSGPMPAEISALTSIQLLTIGGCSISGSIPSQLYLLSELVEWETAETLLTGSIPTDFSVAFSALEGIYMYNGYLTGPIPECIFAPSLLDTLTLSSNFLSGTFAPSLTSKESIFQVSLYSNMLSGPFSVDCSNASVLHSLSVYSNALSGTVSSSLGSCTQLQQLSLGLNSFSGTLPSELQQLPWLQTLNFTNCNLYGDVSSLFANQSFLPNITVLDLSNNAFSGPIPRSLFNTNKSKLAEVVLFSNCFTGYLPDDICEAKALTTVVLDALTSAPQCDLERSGFSTTLLAKRLLAGSIPDCLWSLKLLHTLHLSGNGLVGTLPELPEDSILTDISMANNKISGSIPDSWQDFGHFTNLALQSNRISGTLKSAFNVSRIVNTLDLSVNRLSGDIPSTFRDAYGVNVLTGNLFQCSSSNKPTSDPNSDQYVCGSNALDSSIFAWIGAVAIFLLALTCTFGLKRALFVVHDTRTELVTALERDTFSHHATTNCLACLHSLSQGAQHAMCWFLIIVLPTYLALKLGPSKSEYSTHTYQYAWVLSAGYLHGILPCVLICFFLAICVCQVAMASNASTIRVPCHDLYVYVVRTKLADRQLWLSIGLLAIHSVAMLGVNVSYIVASFNEVSAAQLNAIQFCLGIFKGFWNEVFVSYAMSKLHGSFAPSALMFMAVYIKIFTFLISPAVATVLSDSNCFLYLFTDQPAVSAIFIGESYNCYSTLDSDPDGEYTLSEYCQLVPDFPTKYSTTPVWLYSYQCSSALLTNYVSVIAYSYVFSGVIYPLCTVLYAAPFAQRIVHAVQTKIPTAIRKKYFDSSLYSWDVKGLANLSAASASTDTSKTKKMFDAIRLYSRYVVNMSVIVTFGLSYPLLAVMVAFDSASNLLGTQLLKLRLVRMSLDLGDNAVFQGCCREIDLAADITDIDVGSSLLLLVIIAEAFWVIFVFDMVGDVYGAKLGAVAILGPTFVVHCVFVVWRYAYHGIMKTPTSMLARALSGDVQLDRIYRFDSTTSGAAAAMISRAVSNPIIAPNRDDMNEQFGKEATEVDIKC